MIILFTVLALLSKLAQEGTYGNKNISVLCTVWY